MFSDNEKETPNRIYQLYLKSGIHLPVYNCGSQLNGNRQEHIKVKSSMARSLPVENLLPQNVGSIINYLQ